MIGTWIEYPITTDRKDGKTGQWSKVTFWQQRLTWQPREQWPCGARVLFLGCDARTGH